MKVIKPFMAEDDWPLWKKYRHERKVARLELKSFAASEDFSAEMAAGLDGEMAILNTSTGGGHQDGNGDSLSPALL